MKTFSFLTENSFRIDVKASTAKAGYNKLMSIPYIANKKITKSYLEYDKDGFASVYSWKSL
jgi:hypothetical protein